MISIFYDFSNFFSVCKVSVPVLGNMISIASLGIHIKSSSISTFAAELVDLISNTSINIQKCTIKPDNTYSGADLP